MNRCTYHIVWTPKYRYRILEGLVKEQLLRDIPMFLEWKSCELIEMNIQIDHIYLIEWFPDVNLCIRWPARTIENKYWGKTIMPCPPHEGTEKF